MYGWGGGYWYGKAMGHGAAPGWGNGANVSWSEAPLDPSWSCKDRLAMSAKLKKGGTRKGNGYLAQ